MSRNLEGYLSDYRLSGLVNKYNLNNYKSEHFLVIYLNVKEGWSKKNIEEDYFHESYENNYKAQSIQILKNTYGFIGREWEGIKGRHDDVPIDVLARIVYFGLGFDKKAKYKDDLILLINNLDEYGARELKRLTGKKIYARLDEDYGDDFAKELNKLGRGNAAPKKQVNRTNQRQNNVSRQNNRQSQNRNKVQTNNTNQNNKQQNSRPKYTAVSSVSRSPKVDSIEEIKKKADFHYSGGRYSLAKKEYEKIVERSGMAINDWFSYSNCCYGAGDINMALKAINTYLSYRPYNNDAKQNRAIYLEKLTYYSDALNVLKSLLDVGYKVESIKNDYSRVLCLRGKAYFKKGDYEQALNDFNLCIKNGYGLGEYWFEHAWCNSKKGDYSEALKSINSYLELYPSDNVGKKNRSIYLENLEYYDGALKALEELKASGYKESETNIAIGRVISDRAGKLFKEQKYQKAINDFELLRKRGFNLKNDWFDYSIAKYNLKDYDQSLYGVDQYLKYNPDSKVAYYNKGLILNVKGELKESLKQFNIGKAKGYDVDKCNHMIEKIEGKLRKIQEEKDQKRHVKEEEKKRIEQEKEEKKRMEQEQARLRELKLKELALLQEKEGLAKEKNKLLLYMM